MIKKMRSKLSVKVFFLTAVLTAVCCGCTYLCIVRFAPYIYSHEAADIEYLASEMSVVLCEVYQTDASYCIVEMNSVLADETEDEFVFHIFRSTGEELSLMDWDRETGKRVEDYAASEKTGQYSFRLLDGEEEYVLFASQNTDKESQVVEALHKAMPVISAFGLAASVIAAFFYTWYMTRPIKKISAISRQMADMDFGSLCPVKRTDEIGVLSDSLNELSVRLSVALSELREANRKLQADIDRERELERQRLAFFSAASHELKTPITIIKGQLQGMLYQVGRYQDRETYLAQSLEVTDTLEMMVQELLTISRLETPGYTCKKSTIDFSRFVDERLKAQEELFILRELTLEKFLSPEVTGLGDVRLLEKVTDNLLGNAAAYSPAGNRVIVKLWKEAERVALTIENTGVHIPEEELSKLYEAFYRVDQSRSRQTGGSGLGLYIVKTILDLHGAAIEITNTVQGVMAAVRI